MPPRRCAHALCGLALALVPACASALPETSHSQPTGVHGTIVFGSIRGSTRLDVWVVNADGTDLKQLTDGPDYEFRPTWSPDGSKIPFVAIRGQGWYIYAMSADGSDPVRLTWGPERVDTPAWSPDWRTIAFACRIEARPDICLMNEDGTGVVRIAKGPAADLFPTWSPDGSRIFFVGSLSGNPADYGDVFVMNADGTGVTQLTKGQDVGDYPISPDRTKLVVHDTEMHTLQLIAPYVGTSSTLVDTDSMFATFTRPGLLTEPRLARGRWRFLDRSVRAELNGTGLMKVPKGQDASDPAWRPEP